MPQGSPDQSVPAGQGRARKLALKYRDLLPQREDFRANYARLQKKTRTAAINARIKGAPITVVPPATAPLLELVDSNTSRRTGQGK
jgi:hypothetical protein